jgi:hypothetical protein
MAVGSGTIGVSMGVCIIVSTIEDQSVRANVAASCGTFGIPLGGCITFVIVVDAAVTASLAINSGTFGMPLSGRNAVYIFMGTGGWVSPSDRGICTKNCMQISAASIALTLRHCLILILTLPFVGPARPSMIDGSSIYLRPFGFLRIRRWP